MDFFHGIVALLAFVVLILTALTAWMYIQQTRLMQAVSSLTAVISAPPPSFMEAMREYPHEEELADDRVSVHDSDVEDTPTATTEVEQHPEPEQEEELVDLAEKTVAQLREILNTKGIPFNKSDKKPTLLTLLKAASS
jgi:cytoskeletal protein RodZ